MAWPLSQEYNEAIQAPAVNFTDPDLRRGAVVTSPLGLPLPYSGPFADVYQIRGARGRRWAVKCFTREVRGLRERYQAISRHLGRARLPFTVDFSYLEKGILVGGRWYPVLKMPWVEGLTLNQFVGQSLDRPAMLEALLQIWTRLAKYLRSARVAHCDLQHGNVLLVPGAGSNSLALKLVDYDGMCVPALAGQKSGEVGHPSYQHPQRLQEETYDLDVDRFALLLIATSLRALVVQGRALWEKYDNGDNLLFTQADLQAPMKSHLFLDLVRSSDPLTAALSDHLLKALRGGVASAALLDEAMAEPAPATSVGRAARPIPTATLVAQDGTAVAVASTAVAVSVRSRRGDRSVRTRTSGLRTLGWVAAVIVLLIGLGGLAAFFHMRLDHTPPPMTAPALARNQFDPEPVTTGPQQPRAVTTEPNKEEKEPAKHEEPARSTEPVKPRETMQPRETVKPVETVKPRENVRPQPPPRLEKKITSSIGMRLVPILAGTYLMGSPSAEAGRQENEGPQHEVRITRPFYVGVFPVTKGEFAAFVKDARYQTEAELAGDRLTWLKPGFEQTDDEPVVLVTWNDAVQFCQWLSKKEGRTYGLPAEAQWEYACRAGTTTAYFFGDDPKLLDENAWYGDNSGKQTHSVGGKLWNRWHLYDMCGNVGEWCRDGLRPYTADAVEDPLGPQSPGGQRVLRGGDWSSGASTCRCAARMELEPSQRTNHTGFRVVCEP
jgi:formylglycine-generating enzyme required for sulfatase activity